MRDGELSRVHAETAAEVCVGRKLSAEGQALLADGLTPRAYLEALTASKLFEDAEVVLAHALPKREAVWWGCLCVRLAAGSQPAPEVEAAVKAAEVWTAAPGDVNRRRAYPAAEAIGFGHPAGCVALATFMSGGSLGPPNVNVIPPPEHLTGDLVATAVQVAALLTEPVRAAEKHGEFLRLGFDVARGVSRWKDNL